MTPQELREEADRLEADIVKSKRGTVYIFPMTGTAFVHDGTLISEVRHSIIRQATPSEVEALCVIPEFLRCLQELRLTLKPAAR